MIQTPFRHPVEHRRNKLPTASRGAWATVRHDTKLDVLLTWLEDGGVHPDRQKLGLMTKPTQHT